MKSVLFVCMGNICRSPAAEGVFRQLVLDAGRIAEFDIDSAGTSAYHVGAPADSRMRAVAEQRGYRLDSIARQIHPADFARFHYIIAMDEDNFDYVSTMNGRGAGEPRTNVVRMCDYCEVHEVHEVPDPYYGGEAGFHDVLDILEDACSNLLRRL